MFQPCFFCAIAGERVAGRHRIVAIGGIGGRKCADAAVNRIGMDEVHGFADGDQSAFRFGENVNRSGSIRCGCCGLTGGGHSNRSLLRMCRAEANQKKEQCKRFHVEGLIAGMLQSEPRAGSRFLPARV